MPNLQEKYVSAFRAISDVYRPEGYETNIRCSQCATQPYTVVRQVLQATVMLECLRCDSTFPRHATMVVVDTASEKKLSTTRTQTGGAEQ